MSLGLSVSDDARALGPSLVGGPVPARDALRGGVIEGVAQRDVGDIGHAQITVLPSLGAEGFNLLVSDGGGVGVNHEEMIILIISCVNKNRHRTKDLSESGW
jgi:hypothetical protein